MASTAVPDNIEELGLVALRNGLLKIRLICNDDPRGAYRLADALHNLPQALLQKDYELVQSILKTVQVERS